MAKRLVLAGMLALLMPLAGAAQPIESTLEIAARLAAQPPQWVEAFDYALVFPEAPAKPRVSPALLDMIAAVEHALSKSAKRTLLPMQPGDVPVTHASPALLKALTGYTPDTPIEVGVAAFVSWYREHYGAMA